jgi:DNA-binding SARP family transcriptional activator
MRHELDSPSQTRLCLIGGFALLERSRLLPVPAACQRVLASVALSGRAILRLRVAALLWPDSPEARATAGLRSTLWRLRRIRPGILISTGQHLILDPALDVDVHRLSAEATRLRCAEFTHVDSGAVSHFLGDLLPDWYDDWVLMERERFRQVRLHALEHLCRLLIEAGRTGEAIDAGLAAVAGEPLRETAQIGLISAYLAEGNRCEALRQYERYRALLRRELGLEPSMELREVVRSVTRPVVTPA